MNKSNSQWLQWENPNIKQLLMKIIPEWTYLSTDMVYLLQYSSLGLVTDRTKYTLTINLLFMFLGKLIIVMVRSSIMLPSVSASIYCDFLGLN